MENDNTQTLKAMFVPPLDKNTKQLYILNSFKTAPHQYGSFKRTALVPA
jgi:hypothetical protein